MIRRLDADEAAARWPEFGATLLRALRRGPPTHGLADLLAEVLSGELHVWVAERRRTLLAVVLAELVQHPRYRACHIAWAGGREMAAWCKPMLQALETWARQQGCMRLECRGRAGWQRVAGLRPDGFHMTKEI